MKVFDLQCEHGHRFEGWFGSEDDYQQQLGRGLVECPLCATRAIERRPSAPRLNLSGARAPAEQTPAAVEKPARPSGEAMTPAHAAELQGLILQAMRQMIARTEDVGPQFAEEARRIHYGEAEDRGIRGQATREETEALADEGIEVFSLMLPESLKGPLQ